MQAVGKVVENGPSASRFPIGTRVVAVPWNTYNGDGSWQQYTAVPEDVLVSSTVLLAESCHLRLFMCAKPPKPQFILERCLFIADPCA